MHRRFPTCCLWPQTERKDAFFGFSIRKAITQHGFLLKKRAVRGGRMRGNMDEFIKTLTEQVRCVKAREAIGQEIRNHIMDQAEHYVEEGMEHEQALKEAVRQMGDPVAIGVELDHIHRPQMEWGMLCMAVAFGVAGLLLQYLTGCLPSGEGAFARQCIYMGIGFVMMAGIYYLDYSFIGNHAKELYAAAVLLVLISPHILISTNGMYRGMIMPMYLFIPLYAGILYQYRGQGGGGVLKSIFFLIVPGILAWRLIPSMPTGIHLFLIGGCMLLIAVYRNWFTVDRNKTIVILFATGVLLPALLTLFSWFFLMADYQKVRLGAFVNPELYAQGPGYIYGWVRSTLAQSRFFGPSGFETEYLADSGLLLVQLIASYGSFSGILVIAALTAVILRAFHISAAQKNHLGFMIGAGIGLTFLLLVTEGIAVNFTILPATTVTMPFLTYGGGATIVYDILIGLLLAAYRYRNILGEKSYRARWKIGLKMQKL